jgi:Tfp pilus assembly protein PilF/lipopolysaccharide biosynthesis regulator YciM
MSSTRDLVFIGPLLVTLLIGCMSAFERGTEALQVGDAEGARAAAAEGLDAEPGDPELQLLMARALRQLGDNEGAWTYANRAIANSQPAGSLLGPAHRVAAEAGYSLDRPVDASLHVAEAWDQNELLPDIESTNRLIAQGAEDALAADRLPDYLRLVGALAEIADERGWVIEEAWSDGVLPVVTEVVAATRLPAEASVIQPLIERLIRAVPREHRFSLELGRVMLVRGELDVVRSCFDDFAQNDTHGTPAGRLARVGDAAAASEHWELAEHYYRLAMAADPTAGGGYVGLSAVLFRTDRAEVAMAVLEEAVAALHDFDITATLAEAYLRRDRTTEADDLFRALVDASPEPGLDAERAGDWYRDRRAPSTAVEFYRRAIESGGASDLVHLELAGAYEELGWVYEMVGALNEHLAVDDSAAARLIVSEMLAHHGQWQDTVRVLLPLYQEQPDDRDVALRLARGHYHLGNTDDEVLIYEALIAGAEDPGTATLETARIYVERGEYRSAILWLERATATPTAARETQRELGRAFQRLDQFDAMQRSYSHYISESGGTPASYEDILSELQDARFASYAIDLLEQMIELEPVRNELRLRRAERLLDLDSPARAREGYLDYLLNADDPTLAARTAVRSLQRSREPNLARDVLAAASEQRPDLPGLNLAAALLYLDDSTIQLANGDVEAYASSRAGARRFFQSYLEHSDDLPRAQMLEAAGRMLSADLYDLAAAGFDAALAAGASSNGVERQIARALIRSGGSTDRALEFMRDHLRSSDTPSEDALETTSWLIEAGQLGAAFRMTETAFGSASGDRERESAFRMGAQLLLEQGRSDDLIPWANRLVEGNTDQLSALRVSASYLELAGRYEDARARLELAFGLVGDQADLVGDLARLDYREGDLAGAMRRFERLAGRSRYSWRTAWQYARFFDTQNEFDAARTALRSARDAGGDEPELLVDLGLAEARLGDIDAALNAFDDALDQIARNPASAERRRYLFDAILEGLSRIGRYGAVDDYLSRALGDADLRNFYWLYGADLALRRGDADRGRQLVRAHVEGGQPVSAAIEIYVDRGLTADALDLLRRLVLEGSPDDTASIVEQLAELVVTERGLETLDVWVDTLERRGATVDSLRVEIGRWRARRGDLETAAVVLAAEARERPSLELDVSVLYAARGDSAGAFDALSRYDERVGALSNAGEARFLDALDAVAVLSRADEFEAELTRRADWDDTQRFSLGLLDWLVANGRIHEAVDLFTAQLADPLGGADSAALGVDRTGRHGYLHEAAALGVWSATGSRTPDERLRLAIRYTLESGNSAGAVELLARYRRLGGEHDPSALALADVLLSNRPDALGGIAATLDPVLVGGTHRLAVRALRLSLRLALIGDVSPGAAIDDLAGRYRESSGAASLYRRLLDAGTELERVYQWSRAADHYLSAIELIPGDAGPVGDAARNLFLSGRRTDLVELLSREGALVGSRTDVLLALDRGIPAADDAALHLTIREQALALDPGSYTRRAELAAARLEAGEVDAANVLIEELLAVDRGEALNRQELLTALSDSSHPAAAEQALMVVWDPAVDRDSLRLAAGILASAGDTENAEQALLASVEGLEHLPRAAENAALAAYEWGSYQVSAELALRAIGERPHHGSAYAIRAAARIRLGETEPAAADVAHFLEIADDRRSGLLLVAEAYLAAGHGVAAEALLATLSRAPEVGAGEAYLDGLRRSLEVFAAADEAPAGRDFVERLFPDLMAHPMALGDLTALSGNLRLSGNAAAARQVFDRALARRPESADLFSGLARVLADSGESDRALEVCHRAMAATSQPGPMAVATLAWVHYRAGDSEAARTLLMTAFRLVEAGSPEAESLARDWLVIDSGE